MKKRSYNFEFYSHYGIEDTESSEKKLFMVFTNKTSVATLGYTTITINRDGIHAHTVTEDNVDKDLAHAIHRYIEHDIATHINGVISNLQRHLCDKNTTQLPVMNINGEQIIFLSAEPITEMHFQLENGEPCTFFFEDNELSQTGYTH